MALAVRSVMSWTWVGPSSASSDHWRKVAKVIPILVASPGSAGSSTYPPSARSVKARQVSNASAISFLPGGTAEPGGGDAGRQRRGEASAEAMAGDQDLRRSRLGGDEGLQVGSAVIYGQQDGETGPVPCALLTFVPTGTPNIEYCVRGRKLSKSSTQSSQKLQSVPRTLTANWLPALFPATYVM